MIKQDLLYTLGSAISIFAPTKNGAVARLEAILANGSDPGQGQAVQLPSRRHSASATTDDVDEPESSPDIEQAAHDQISIRVGEEFAGHDLATLVTGLLEADGLKCIQSPPGPDGGIDIVAGRELLGLDDPILVQVKSGSQVGSPVVNQLHGVMASHGARQGLLVAWGGLTKSSLRGKLCGRVSCGCASGTQRMWWMPFWRTTTHSRRRSARACHSSVCGSSRTSVADRIRQADGARRWSFPGVGCASAKV